ncbi:MAG: VCBS repeat-containing protein [Pseudomonadota bacterium]|nr:VCBS repeat-containing protein [Pseudomonadota bacterium]
MLFPFLAYVAAAETDAVAAATALFAQGVAQEPVERWADVDAAGLASFTWQARTADDVGAQVWRTPGSADPEARLHDVQRLVGGSGELKSGCAVGAALREWRVAGPPGEEVLARWPARTRLTRMATVSLACPVADGTRVLLSDTSGTGWRIVAFLGAQRTDAFAEWATRDEGKARAAATAALRGAVPPVKVTRWSPPGLARVRPNRDDVDGDGVADALVGTDALYLGGSGRAVALPGSGRGLVLGDVDGDGRADVLAAVGDYLEVWPAGDRARYRILGDAGPADRAWSAGDLDGDGRIDLVAARREVVRVWFGGGDGVGAELHAPGNVAALAVARDRDGDGRDELVIGVPSYGGGHGAVWVLSPRSTGAQSSALTFVGGYGEAWGQVNTADFDRDGRDDVTTLAYPGDRGPPRLVLLSASGARPQLRTACLDPRGQRAPGAVRLGDATVLASACGTNVVVQSSDGAELARVERARGWASVGVRVGQATALAVRAGNGIALLGAPGWEAGRMVAIERAPWELLEDQPVALIGADPGQDHGLAAGGVDPAPPPITWSTEPAAPVLPPTDYDALDDVSCVVRVEVDGSGVPKRADLVRCPRSLLAPTQAAVMAARVQPGASPRTEWFLLRVNAERGE